jgi:hypothetical protein
MIELEAHFVDLGDPEAPELRAGLIDREPRPALAVSQTTVCNGAYIIARGS